MTIRRFVATLLLVASAASAQPATDLAFDQRIRKLEEQLRCLVCQNQTLADSGAGLADDLRREVRTLAMSGKSDDEIRAFLVARYGDFILYDPPVKPRTWLLWFGPFALLVAGGVIWMVIVRRRRDGGGDDSPSGLLGSDAKARARAWLDEEPPGV